MELKSLAKPHDIIKMVFDCVLLLMGRPIGRTAVASMSIGIGRARRNIDFIQDSYALAKVRQACTATWASEWASL